MRYNLAMPDDDAWLDSRETVKRFIALCRQIGRCNLFVEP
jgi:hypothetical protein